MSASGTSAWTRRRWPGRRAARNRSAPKPPSATAELIGNRDVCLEHDITERDRYGRLLRYVWLPDGRLANEVLLREGLATVTTYPPDVKYVKSRYLPAQREAQAAGLGRARATSGPPRRLRYRFTGVSTDNG